MLSACHKVYNCFSNRCDMDGFQESKFSIELSVYCRSNVEKMHRHTYMSPVLELKSKIKYTKACWNRKEKLMKNYSLFCVTCEIDRVDWLLTKIEMERQRTGNGMVCENTMDGWLAGLWYVHIAHIGDVESSSTHENEVETRHFERNKCASQEPQQRHQTK